MMMNDCDVVIWTFYFNSNNSSNEILYTVIHQSKLELKRAAGVKRGKRTLISKSR